MDAARQNGSLSQGNLLHYRVRQAAQLRFESGDEASRIIVELNQRFNPEDVIREMMLVGWWNRSSPAYA